jgi:dTDP-4-amino-4,6-dideoxygalactose transaminase
MDWRVTLSDLDYGPEEEQAVMDVLRSRWLTMGAVTQAFESQFAEMLGVKYALAVANATVALHLACIEIGPGDEVIVPSLTFAATANAVLYTGAEVRFADILGPHELTLDPLDVERRITSRTRAIMVMHYAGYPCRMPEIQAVADRHGLAVIEDAAHAPGASLQGRMMGAWGEVACFSFFSNKNLAVGEGGMLVTDRSDIAERVRRLRSHGMTSLTWDRHSGHAYSYDVVDLGYNYRLDEIRSALGVAQLKKLAANNACRREITRHYWQALADTPLELPFRQAAGESSAHIFPVLLPAGADRRAFIDQMRSAGVQTSIHYPPIHQFTYHSARYPGVSLPQTEAVAARQVTLPLYPRLSHGQVETVVAAVRHSLNYV